MIVIWSIGGDMVIIYYSNKQCGLKISDFLMQVICPVLCISVCMFIGGFAIKSLFEESFLRLIFCLQYDIYCLWNWCLEVCVEKRRENKCAAIDKWEIEKK